MADKQSRMIREEKTFKIMIGIYCRDLHGSPLDVLCSECSLLLEYAQDRLSKCPFQGGKTTCAHCPVHCYRSDMRHMVKDVMRYSGPRMVWRHPLLAVYHFIDGFRKKPIRPVRKREVKAKTLPSHSATGHKRTRVTFR